MTFFHILYLFYVIFSYTYRYDGLLISSVEVVSLTHWLLLPGGKFLVIISVKDLISSRVIARLQLLSTLKEYPMIPIGYCICDLLVLTQRYGTTPERVRNSFVMTWRGWPPLTLSDTGLCRRYINITITILDTIRRPVFYLKHEIMFVLHRGHITSQLQSPTS
jgi:hypothetical protein